MEDRELNLYEDVAALKVSVATIDRKLDDLIKYLQGNGKPGVIADLRLEDARQDGRMDKIESRATWLTGVWVGSSTVIGLIVAAIKIFFHR